MICARCKIDWRYFLVMVDGKNICDNCLTADAAQLARFRALAEKAKAWSPWKTRAGAFEICDALAAELDDPPDIPHLKPVDPTPLRAAGTAMKRIFSALDADSVGCATEPAPPEVPAPTAETPDPFGLPKGFKFLTLNTSPAAGDVDRDKEGDQ